jgi:signal transduction histidine kinase
MSLADDSATTADPATKTNRQVRTDEALEFRSTVESREKNEYGISFCRLVWKRIQSLSPLIWLTLPTALDSTDSDVQALLCTADSRAHRYMYAALEVERALHRGIQPGTGLALVLLATVALEHFDGGASALKLTETAVELAARCGSPYVDHVRVLRAALALPLADKLNDAACALVPLSQAGAASSMARAHLSIVGFTAAMPLPALLQQLQAPNQSNMAEVDTDTSGIALGARTRLLNCLLDQKSTASIQELDLISNNGQERQFSYWLTRLQTAWYAGRETIACHASAQAMAFLDIFTPAAERLTYHTFSALAKSRSTEGGAAEQLRFHTAALCKLASVCPASGGPMAKLAKAAGERHRGNATAALGGFETAASEAAEHRLHWVAALAWEEAALQAAECGLASAAHHYRQQALKAYRQWGAYGRIDALQRNGNIAEDTSMSDGPAGHGSSSQVGIANELGLSIAHEVNQPLAAIALHAAAARKWLRRPEPDIERALTSLSLISAAGRQAGGIVRSVQRLAAGQKTEMSEVQVDDAIAEALQLLHRRLDKHGIDVELALGLGERVIHANRVQLQQLVTNLVVNAIEALANTSLADPHRRIRIESRNGQGQQIEIAVADTGPVIEPRDRDLMFSSLFSTKPKNTGMGLSISLAIVRSHGGHIEFEPCEPHGACFRFRLPVHGKVDSGIS